MEHLINRVSADELKERLKCGLLREVYQHKLVTEEQYMKLSEQQRGR